MLKWFVRGCCYFERTPNFRADEYQKVQGFIVILATRVRVFNCVAMESQAVLKQLHKLLTLWLNIFSVRSKGCEYIINVAACVCY